MISDMKPEDIVGEYKEVTLHLYKSITRRILYTEIETPYQMASSLFLPQRLMV